MIRVVPLELKEANALVRKWHRHHIPSVGHRFSLGAIGIDGTIHGAIIVGRTVARNPWKPRNTLEVTRLVTDGTPNVCSMLYQAAARAGQAMGYERIQTYILDSEPGTSLKASGWTKEPHMTAGRQWTDRPGKNPACRVQPTCPKQRWARQLNPPHPHIDESKFYEDSEQK